MIELMAIALFILSVIMAWQAFCIYHKKIFGIFPKLRGYDIIEARLVYDVIMAHKAEYRLASDAYGHAIYNTTRVLNFRELKRKNDRARRRYYRSMWLAKKMDRLHLLVKVERHRLNSPQLI